MNRADFPILKETVHGRPLVYLDNAATSQKPQAVIDAIAEAYTHWNSNIHRGAPGRLGIWLGWRIAESYMEHNETVTLQELMAEGDAQKILEESYYKP